MPPDQAKRVRKLQIEYAKRTAEALQLYTPLPHVDEFHRSNVPERILRGSNRAGKTLGAAVEIARAVTGQDPYGKYPQEHGRCFIVGADGKHNGEVLYRKLFRPGAFKVIRDERTKKWRAWQPWEAEDAAREKEAISAPPLIPPRLVKETSWENKKEQVPNVVRLINGWEIRFFSSLGKPPQGNDVDLVWFDEEIVDEEWYPECAVRGLVDRNGKFVWSATAQKGGYQLYELCMTAEKQFLDKWENPRIKEYLVHLDVNPHITQEMKDLFFEKLTPEQRKVRIAGEFEFTAMRVFPEFSWRTHGHEWFEIPKNWTRYMVVDPGRQVCAALFAAVPAPSHELAGHLFLYDELYIRNCDTTKFARAVREKTHGQSFRDFIIDHQGGRVRYMDEGGSQEWQLSEALRKVKVRSQLSKHGFTWGSPDVPAGLEKARSLLVEKLPNGRPILQVLVDKCPSFQWEIDRYHFRKEKSIVTDKPEQRNSHLMDCFDEQTEVLTESGWQPFSAVTMRDSLATVNLDTDLIEYQQPSELIDKEGPGEMIRFGGHKMNALVTPGHRMVVYPDRSHESIIKEAQHITSRDRLRLWGKWDGVDSEVFLLPRCLSSHSSVSPRVFHEKELDPEAWAEFLGWWIAEGWCTKSPKSPGRGYQVGVTQNRGMKRELLRFTLSQLPWRWHENDLGFYTSSKQLWNYLQVLGDSYTKRVPSWIKQSSPRIIHRFVSSAVLGDGWSQHDRRSYATVSRQLADDMQELFMKLGRTASVRVRPEQEWNIRGKSGQSRQQYWVSEWIRPMAGLRDSQGKPNFQPEPYEGRVYCASVPNGTLIVRREGKPMVAGNCLRYLAMYEPRWHPPPKRVGKGVYHLVQQKRKKERKQHGPPGITLGPVAVRN